MILHTPGHPHLTYCSNIHPGETWERVRENLERYTVPVKQRVAPGRDFGLGLRLSARAAETLEREAELEELRGFLAENGLYLFTLNGFPYGPFHGEPVKEEVYLPDWTTDERVVYTDRLARLMAEVMPSDRTVEGSISTVPGGFRPHIATGEAEEAVARNVARHATQLHRLREETGQRIALALEPEPCCYLEVIEEAVRFFEERLWRSESIARFAAGTGLGKGDAEERLREHVGVCFDTCHAAVEYESCETAVRRLQGAGVRIVKAQVTAGLEVDLRGSPADVAERLSGLASFADEVYLHQVVAPEDGTLRRFLDLPDALERWESGDRPRECRIHFHVPVFREELGPFRGTQGFVREFLELVRKEETTPHLELETYTWDVLPEEFRREGPVAAVAGELEWVLGQLRIEA